MSNSNAIQNFLGKFRGTVLNNVDPETRGRLMLSIPDVLGVVPSRRTHRATDGCLYGAADRCRRMGGV
jgi:hypothetical protein